MSVNHLNIFLNRQRLLGQKYNKDSSLRTASTQEIKKKQVHFGSAVNYIYYDDCESDDRWYNKEMLQQQFLEDLEEEYPNGTYQYDSSTLSSSVLSASSNQHTSRGLEYHAPQNKRRAEQVARYIAAVVNKSYELRKEKNLTKEQLQEKQHPFSRKLRFAMPKKMLEQQQQVQPYEQDPSLLPKYQALAEELKDYASDLTWMTKDLAIGVAALDEEAAMAIHSEQPKLTYRPRRRRISKAAVHRIPSKGRCHGLRRTISAKSA